MSDSTLSLAVQVTLDRLFKFSEPRLLAASGRCDVGLATGFGNVKLLSRVQLFATPWTVACQAPLSMGFCRQEYWCGLPFPSLVDLPKLGIKPRSPLLQADSLPSEPPGNPPPLITKGLIVTEERPRWAGGSAGSAA